jgi:23S rRNA G2069 N7-methylase RlmK/C1962 C5-methylase RlmI
MPSDQTTTYRLINGEGDRLSGLMVDVLGQTVVVQSSALWVELYRDIITAAVNAGVDGRQVLWKQAESRLRQDGWKGALDLDEGKLQDTDSDSFVLEDGVKYILNASKGQKTGFYCDQRDNKKAIRALSHGRTVYDGYCYSGGFGINAALGGATSVLSVDSSQDAVDMTLVNAEANGIGPDRLSAVRADAVKHMTAMTAEGRTFDLVIVDPPKLAPSRKSLDKAKGKYVKINAAAMRLVRPGGLLLTCSCSAAVTQTGLLPQLISSAARAVGRSVTIVSTSSAGADHPVHAAYPEGKYLTACLCVVQ